MSTGRGLSNCLNHSSHLQVGKQTPKSSDFIFNKKPVVKKTLFQCTYLENDIYISPRFIPFSISVSKMDGMKWDRSLITLELPCCEEAQAVWRSPGEVLADSQNQMPVVGVKMPPDDSRSQPSSLPNRGPRHCGAEMKSCLCCVLPIFLIHRTWKVIQWFLPY